MRAKGRLIGATLAMATLALGIGAARAEPVTYSLSGSFTGTLGVQSFTSDPGTITFTGDTSGITNQGGGFYTDTGGVGTITLRGIGTAIIAGTTFGANGSNDTAGLYDTSTRFGASIYDPLLGDYMLSTPFSDTAPLEIAAPFLQPFPSELTSLGELTLTGDDGSSATFSAGAISAAPEPSTWALMIAGLGLVGAMLRLQRRRGALATA